MSYSPEVAGFIAEGSQLYALKDFDQAATKYADACSAYNEENGADDADLLLLYGKALFQSGVAKSGVLGGVGNDEEREEKKEEEEEENDNFQFEEGVAEEEEVDEEDPKEEEAHESEQSEDEGANEEGDANEDEDDQPDQTDFEASWDILDLARTLFSKALEDLPKEEAVPLLKSDDEEPTSKYVVTLRKLSETYDLLGEVSLESENFPQAASDLESCLSLRKQLYNPQLLALVSESHYKLSLALEFCVEDPELRLKAAEQMKLAIDCIKLRNATETDIAKKKDTEELLRDLGERYKELKRDPEEELKAQQMDIIQGILGGVAPVAANDLSTMVKKKPVNDLSSMVKKRKAKPDTAKEAKKPKAE